MCVSCVLCLFCLFFCVTRARSHSHTHAPARVRQRKHQACTRFGLVILFCLLFVSGLGFILICLLENLFEVVLGLFFVGLGS